MVCIVDYNNCFPLFRTVSRGSLVFSVVVSNVGR